MSRELERTKYTNRQLVLQHCNRPNIFTKAESPMRGPESQTVSSKMKDRYTTGQDHFSNAKIQIKLLGDNQSNPLSLAIEEESENSRHGDHANQEYRTLLDPETQNTCNLDLRKICQRANREVGRPSTAANSFRKPKIGIKKLSIDPNSRRIESARNNDGILSHLKSPRATATIEEKGGDRASYVNATDTKDTNATSRHVTLQQNLQASGSLLKSMSGSTPLNSDRTLLNSSRKLQITPRVPIESIQLKKFNYLI